MGLFQTTQEQIEHQQWVADTVIDMLYPIDPYTIVAGGAPRDWYLGKPATDVDVFFHSAVDSITQIEEMLKRVGLTLLHCSRGDCIPAWYKLNPNLIAVYDTEIEGVKVQIMQMRKSTFSSVVPEFPLSISKVWYRYGKIVPCTSFAISVQRKIIVKTSTIYDSRHPYLQKILAKFPDYKYYDGWEAASSLLLHE